MSFDTDNIHGAGQFVQTNSGLHWVCRGCCTVQANLPQLFLEATVLLVQGNVYRPNVVRIGSEEAPVSQRAREVWVDLLIARYTDMDPAAWQRRQTPCTACIASLRC